jgi:hypothetical protein
MVPFLSKGFVIWLFFFSLSPTDMHGPNSKIFFGLMVLPLIMGGGKLNVNTA